MTAFCISELTLSSPILKLACSKSYGGKITTALFKLHISFVSTFSVIKWSHQNVKKFKAK